MNSKLILTALLVLVILASGCITGEETYSPKATLDIAVTQPPY